MTTQEISTPDHLFVGYANEDAVFAKWITLRLTVEGYKVWCDQVKLLGGESYPLDIRKAIRNSTFRFLAVISKHSIDKPMPLSERTLARRVGEDRNIRDFLIPLNLDGSKAADLDIITSDITYVPFRKGWAAGFSQLLAKLERIHTPKSRPNGKEAVVSWLKTQQEFVEKKKEQLWSNLIQIDGVPDEIHRYIVTNIVRPAEDNWPIFSKSKDVVWAFGPPGPDASVHARKSAYSANWTTELEADDLDTFHIATGILRQTIKNFCIKKGMKLSTNGKDIYFPFGLLPKDKLTYRRFDGKSVYVKAVGKKTVKKNDEREVSWYHLAPVFQPIINRFGNPKYQLNFRLVWTDEKGNEKKVQTGRRRMKWYNYQWLARTLAVNSWLTDGKDSQDVLVSDSFKISIAGRPLLLTTPYHINEDFSDIPEEDDDENEVIEEEAFENEDDEEPQIEDTTNTRID